jgi:L-asparaginase
MNNFHFQPRRRVMIIYTGGTIGMIRNPESGALETFNFEHLRKHVPELNQFDYVIQTYQFAPPIDSSDMEPSLWAKLARIIEYNYDQYDGFVILHGTDTMAYTASALSFMLENLGKPVVLTGSQLPIGILRTDGKENLINAIELAAARDEQNRPYVPEVCVYFGEKLFRGNRCTKCNVENFSAFTSYNFAPLAVTGINVNYNTHEILRPDKNKPFKIHPVSDCSVVILPLYPGIRREIVEQILSLPTLKGVVLRSYGAGNAPRKEWLVKALKMATKNGKVIVNTTQCQTGRVEMSIYETGNQLREAGVVSGHDMTVECAVTKLMNLFGRGYDTRQVSELMGTSLAGELS